MVVKIPMILNHNSEPVFTSKDLIKEIYKGNLELILKSQVDYNTDIDYLSYVEFVTENNLDDWPVPHPYFGDVRTTKELDELYQNNWYIPEKYKNYDIEEHLYSLCSSDIEIKRVSQELILFKKHNMITLLKFLKYLVDIMRQNNILWGVGRGSSVASFCLYLLGIHKIDSIKYDLDIEEFLR